MGPLANVVVGDALHTPEPIGGTGRVRLSTAMRQGGDPIGNPHKDILA